MGQPVTVVKKPSSKPGVVRFELNRSITGMGHERYSTAPPAVMSRPCDEIARRLFAHEGVEHVHINSNVITVNMAFGADGGEVQDTVQDMFLYYTDTEAEADADVDADTETEVTATAAASENEDASEEE